MQKIAVVTGSAGNLGKAVVNELINAGFRVYGTILHHEKVEEQEHLVTTAVDVSNQEEVSAFFKNVHNKEGRIDLSVFTVGGFGMGKLGEAGIKDFDHLIKLNFNTALFSTQAALNVMKGQQYKSQLVYFGAKPALDFATSHATFPYAISKSMVINMAEALNSDPDYPNVRASVIAPGIVDTPQNRSAMANADFSKWVTPDEIARIVRFLSKDEAMRETVIKAYKDS